MQPNYPLNSKYKTSMCRHYEATKTCQLGDRCNFAHGEQELRGINDVIFVGKV